MSVWRDIQEQAELLKKRRHWQGVRVLGLDGAYVQGWGKKQPVLVAVDLGSGQPVALGSVNEHDHQAVRRFLEPLVKRLGVSEIVTDDLTSYRVVAEKLDVEQQICQFHLRRWVGRSLYELRETVPKQWLWVLDEVKALLDELPPEGSKHLFELWKQIPERRVGQSGARSPLEQLRYLLIRLSEHWASYRVFDWQREVPWTKWYRASHWTHEELVPSSPRDAQSHIERIQILAGHAGCFDALRFGCILVLVARNFGCAKKFTLILFFCTSFASSLTQVIV
jgi:hypothetical protein